VLIQADQTVGVLPSAAALRSETSRVGPGFIAALTVAFFGTWVALLPATLTTLALRVVQIAPDDRTGALSLILAGGAAVAVLSQNVFGALSDRTTSRFGMRRPWIVTGAALGVASLGLVALATSVISLFLAWATAQLTFNMLLAGLNPVLPDQVPRTQLGRVSAMTTLTQPLGIVGGTFLVRVFLPDLRFAILVPGCICIAGVAALALLLHDRHLVQPDRKPLNLRLLVLSYWTDPRTAPDFGWTWLSRFLVSCGIFTIASYQTFFLMSRFGYTPETIGAPLLQGTLLNTVGLVVASVAFGTISDRLRRRKSFVLVSAAGLALALLLAAYSQSLSLYFVATTIAGIAVGCYLAVDLALVAEVLPSRADAGKDMSVFHLANALPQMLVPAVAPLFLAIGGGPENFQAFFVAGAVAGVAGAVVIQFVRSVA
jgi:MFS family permease